MIEQGNVKKEHNCASKRNCDASNLGDENEDKIFLPEGSKFYVILKSRKKYSGLSKLKQIYPSLQKYSGF